MKSRYLRLFCLFACFFALSVTGLAAERYWVANVYPASILVGVKSGDFEAVLSDGRSLGPTTLSTMPNLSGGAGFGFEDFDVEVTGGGGLVINGSYLSYMLNVQAGLYYRPDSAPSFTWGPRLGIIYFSAPDWNGTTSASFSSSLGFLGGLHLTMGDRISYVFSLDYIKASSKVKSVNALPAGGDSFDMDGLAVQFGIHGQF